VIVKVLAVLYPDARPEEHPDVLASTECALDLRPLRATGGHQLVTISDTGEELDYEMADAEVVITTPFWPVYLDRARIESAKRLRLVITTGVGSDHIDEDATREHGVAVTEVTGSNVVSVAEHNVMQILALVRKMLPAHTRVAYGRWDVAEASARAHDVEEKTVGLVGPGAIGARTALRLKGFDVRML
jgi:formate dehydrogenase